MNPDITDPKALEVYEAVQKAKFEKIESLGLGLLFAIVVMTIVISILIYNLSPTTVNSEEQAIRVVELKKVQACVSHGGSWIPVRQKIGGGSFSMSCVTPLTLSLVTKMNKAED